MAYRRVTQPQADHTRRGCLTIKVRQPLFDYKDFREKMDLEKAYLQGRFDALPYINEFESI
ncbi:MAG: hypothetical protein K2K81_01615 [Muribaculaceae bacterium]|nr:hypothetical protein [Muribaculaceae bacterium]